MEVQMKARGVFGISTLFAILTALITVTLYASSMRNDIDYQAQKIEVTERRIEQIQSSCVEMQKDFKQSMDSEISARKDEYTQIQIKLSEIDTHLIYIKQALMEKKE